MREYLKQDLDWEMNVSLPSRIAVKSGLKKKRVSKNSYTLYRLREEYSWLPFFSGIPCKPWKMFKRIEKYWVREARWGQADSLGSVFKAYRALFHGRLIYPRAQLLKNSLLSFYGSISWKLLVLPSKSFESQYQRHDFFIET